jgi:hypothetical protein
MYTFTYKSTCDKSWPFFPTWAEAQMGCFYCLLRTSFDGAVCVWVCVYVCVYVYRCLSLYVTYVHLCVGMCAHVHIQAASQMHFRADFQVLWWHTVYVYAPAVWTYATPMEELQCICTWLHVCNDFFHGCTTHIRMYMRVWLRAHMHLIYIYIHTHTHRSFVHNHCMSVWTWHMCMHAHIIHVAHL